MNEFQVKIPDSIKEAILNNNAELWINFYFNKTTKELEKYLILRRNYDGLTRNFYYNPNYLEHIEKYMTRFIYEGQDND